MDFLKGEKCFSFLYDGKPVWEQAMTASVEEAGNTATITYLLPDGLKMTHLVTRYPAFNACEWVTWFENTGSVPSQIISQLWDADVTLPFPHQDNQRATAFVGKPEAGTRIYAPKGSNWGKDEFFCDVDALEGNEYIHHAYPGGKPRTYHSRGGRSSDLQAPFFHVHYQGTGVIFAIGWSGQWNAAIARQEDSLTIQTKIEDTHFRLLAGEKIRTSSFVMMRYTGDFDEAQNTWRRLIKTSFSIIGRPGRPAQLPLCAGIWGGMQTEHALERIRMIRENHLPFEYIWMDAGRYGNGTLSADGSTASAEPAADRPDAFPLRGKFQYTFPLFYAKMLVVTHCAAPFVVVCKHYCKGVFSLSHYFFCCCTYIVYSSAKASSRKNTVPSYFPPPAARRRRRASRMAA